MYCFEMMYCKLWNLNDGNINFLFFCRELLLGIACNMHIKNLHLDLSSNDLQAQGGQVLGGCIGNISSITSLDISNNSKFTVRRGHFKLSLWPNYSQKVVAFPYFDTYIFLL